MDFFMRSSLLTCIGASPNLSRLHRGFASIKKCIFAQRRGQRAIATWCMRSAVIFHNLKDFSSSFLAASRKVLSEIIRNSCEDLWLEMKYCFYPFFAMCNFLENVFFEKDFPWISSTSAMADNRVNVVLLCGERGPGHRRNSAEERRARSWRFWSHK